MPNEGVSARSQAHTFAAYLGAPQIPVEIAERYQLAVQDWPTVDVDRFDRWLLRFAAAHRVTTSLADSYARIARPYGDLRRRLTLMLALLETHGATHAAYDCARPSNAVLAWLALGATAFGWALRTVIAALICAPAHVFTSVAAPDGR